MSTATDGSSIATISCCDCGAVQHVPDLAGRAAAFCHRCRRTLERTAGRSATAALACSLSALMLLIPSYALPLWSMRFAGATQHLSVASTLTAAWRDGAPLLAGAVLLMLMVFPVLRLTLLSVVLTALMLGRRSAQLGRLFRWSEEIRRWTNLDVFALALTIMYFRLPDPLTAEMGIGWWSLLGAAALTGFAASTLNPRAVWRAIMPERRPEQAAAEGCEGCDVCELVAAPGEEHCARCGQRLVRTKTNPLGVAAALVTTSALLYVPSYLYPMSYVIEPGGTHQRTVFSGIMDLIHDGLWLFAIVVIVASIFIPALKVVGLSWLLGRSRHMRIRDRVHRTRLHRFIHDIGRWSMTDPLIAAGTAGFMTLGGIAEAHVGPAATPFTLVVVLTLLASRWFDARLMWRHGS